MTLSNAKICITTTLKQLDHWLDYVRDSGYSVREDRVGDDVYYYSDDAPGYGKLTPLATVIRNRARRSVWIHIRLPQKRGC